MESAIEQFHIHLEESRNGIIQCAQSNFQSEIELHECQESLSTIYHNIQGSFFDIIPLSNGNNKAAIEVGNEVWIAMVDNCKLKACQLAKELCLYVTSTAPPGSNSGNNGGIVNIRTTLIDHNGMESQAAIAQIVELTMRLIVENHASVSDHEHDKGVEDEIQEIRQRYTAYQRALLRIRSKPAIENIAQIRKYAKQSQLFVSEYINQITTMDQSHNDDDDNVNNPSNLGQQQHVMDQEELNRYKKQPYAHAVTVILGETSSLLHPLLMWLNGIQSILLSHEEEEEELRQQQERTTNNHNILAKENNIQSSLKQMLMDTIDTIHLEAERLSVTIGNWFIQDHQESFVQMNKPQHFNNGNGMALDNNQHHHNHHTLDLSILDNSLDEMAYVCQVIHRYCNFTQHIAQHLEEKAQRQTKNEVNKSHSNDGDKTQQSKTTLRQHLQEQSLFYSTTETKLTNANLNQALHITKPVEMILGMKMYVPSIVDDAYFISTRALERARGTLENRAIWTIALWVVDVWSVNDNSDGSVRRGTSHCDDATSNISIYHALLEMKGCTVNEEEIQRDQDTTIEAKGIENSNSNDGKKKGFLFSSVLIDALDSSANSKDANKKAPKSGPLSGSLLNNKPTVDVHKVQMDTQLCNLNGIQAASSACMGLAEFFESLLAVEHDGNDGNDKELMDDQTASMIKLAKEQMETHSKSYKDLLQQKIQHIVMEWCGTIDDTHTAPSLAMSLRQSPCLDRFYFYISNEEYYLDSSDFYKAETDERLERVLMGPFHDSRLLAQVRHGKCDEGVINVIMPEISCQIVSIMFNTIVNQKKKFSEWGSLLLSKQIRMLERYVCSFVLNDDRDPSLIRSLGVNTSHILNEFQKIKQTLSILQLDKPSDWSAFSYEIGDGGVLSQAEVRSIMKLRGDWSIDSIMSVCGPETLPE